MHQNSLEPAIQHLHGWRLELIEKLRSGDASALDLKLAAEAAIRWLEACQRHPFPAGGTTVMLPLPEDFEPFGDYRVMWDAETEDRQRWREVARASPGDLLIRHQS
jgi:hypothetical protein